jgi:hypothetical protein
MDSFWTRLLEVIDHAFEARIDNLLAVFVILLVVAVIVVSVVFFLVWRGGRADRRKLQDARIVIEKERNEREAQHAIELQLIRKVLEANTRELSDGVEAAGKHAEALNALTSHVDAGFAGFGERLGGVERNITVITGDLQTIKRLFTGQIEEGAGAANRPPNFLGDLFGISGRR